MKKKKETINKGEYGYIDSEKKKKLTLTVLSFIAVLVIFLTGVIIYHTNKSIFAVIAAVSALPAAKLLTIYISMHPYKSGDKEMYEKLKGLAGKNDEYKAIVGADFIITSRDKAMNIQFAYIVAGKAVCYAVNKKATAKEIEDYVKQILDAEECQYSSVKVFDDEKKFLKYVTSISLETGKEYTDKRIFEKLCAYSM